MKPIKLTKPQCKVLVALHMRNGEYHSRRELALFARGNYVGYPMKTMKALWRCGLAEPENQFVVKLVESKRCRCGCDAWRITDAGKAYVMANIKVHIPATPGGKDGN